MRALAARAGTVLAAAALVLAPTFATAPAHADEIRDRQRPILRILGAEEAWKITRGAGVTVAVVDSGVDPDQPDLRGSVTVGPNMLAGIDGRRVPKGRHGTGMASLIAGHGHGPGGRDGVIGIAPEARILALRVLAEPGDPSYAAYRADRGAREAVAKGIRYAVDHGADVINLSLGNTRPTSEDREAVAYAITKGVVVVSAVGNDGGKRDLLDDDGFAPYSYPASYPGVIAVAATDTAHKRAPFSSRNHSVVLSAPGVAIPVAGPGDGYFLTEGTSDSSALVSGIAALIRSRHPDMKPSLVRQALLDGTRFRPSGKYDASTGFGVVNAVDALRAADAVARTPRGAGALPSGQRFGGAAPGPVKVIHRAPWTEPVAVAVIVLTVAGMAVAVAIAVMLYRRTRPSPWRLQPAMAAVPPPPPVPPPLVFHPGAPPAPAPSTPVFERPDAPSAVETSPPQRPAPAVPSFTAGTGARPAAPSFEAPDPPPGPRPPTAPPRPAEPLLGRWRPPPGAGRPLFEPPATPTGTAGHFGPPHPPPGHGGHFGPPQPPQPSPAAGGVSFERPQPPPAVDGPRSGPPQPPPAANEAPPEQP
ncbi:type VII secretion-associated serine protease mycosin [Thermomonospora echinospora]|uniref:Type VII secretion-associated serine protease mycosin n=1 Tax=Thermomonospora echinospora TaxID=1992 RepID=A0A1H5VCS5_9ACTN|nr:S8 family serine peptidase [Thermomonospora echinospora]SEF85033.1 type VII secretion-associated serine protease mycosin [Thermomonospora echinospora]